jgi:linoleate 10R-lipoxygenase
VVLMSRLPNQSDSLRLQKVLMRICGCFWFINKGGDSDSFPVFLDLPSPPASYLNVYDHRAPVPVAPRTKRVYAFRSADGSNYNPLFPSLGKAGSPYARSVPGLTPLPKHALPDAGLVFDTLLRREEFTPHPGGVSSLFFAFANLIIHDLFSTNRIDWTKNDTTSYLDLSILYGKSQEEQDLVRRKDGTGRLWDDVFADRRLLLMPPASCALLVLLSRHHNVYLFLCIFLEDY